MATKRKLTRKMNELQKENIESRKPLAIIILRWLLVLPVSSFTYFLGSMILAQIFLVLFPESSYLRKEVPNTDGLINALFIGKTISCFFSILAGAYTAPSRRFMVAVLLTIIPIIAAFFTIGGFVALVYLDSDMSLSEGLTMIDWAHIEAVMGSALSIVACILIRRYSKDKIG